MYKQFDENVPVMTRLKNLNVGEFICLPLSKYHTVASNISHYKLTYGMNWTTRVRKESGVFEVARTE